MTAIRMTRATDVVALRRAATGRIAVDIGAAVALAALVLAAIGPEPQAIGAVALAAVAPALARTDIAVHRLPNRMTVPVIAAGLASAALAAVTGGDPRPALLSAAVSGGLMLVLALVGGLGMGDVKLAIAIGLASPTVLVAIAAPVLGILAGGLAGAVGIVLRGPRHRLPYGPFLLLGWVAALGLELVANLIA